MRPNAATRSATMDETLSMSGPDGPPIAGRRYRESIWSRRRPPKTRHAQLLSQPSRFLAAIIILALLAVTPAGAVRIPFSNCLADSYRLGDPPPLQWEPLYADVVFDTQGDNHNLQVIVWGNVSGSMSSNSLPGPNDPYWTDDNKTDGKIIQSPEPENDSPTATTLYRKIDVLTFEPWNQGVDFCVSGLVNASCPLGPVFNTDNM